MHGRVCELEEMLRRWCQSDYGKFWLRMARNEDGVIRVKPGQWIPVVHFIALGDRPIFIGPKEVVREGHRMVGFDQFESGRPLDNGELALGPEIRLDVVQDAALLAAAFRGDIDLHTADVKKPSQVFSVPARYLLAPSMWPQNAYVLYQHIFGKGNSYPNDGYFYVGVTKRSWRARWAEHRRAAENGSPLLFHRTLRDELAVGHVTYIHHKVMAITDDLEALYRTEEWLVKEHWHDQRRLNMIPGGKSGLKYLRENGLLTEGLAPQPDDRDEVLSEWLKTHPRKGLPAPWVSELWKNNAWAIAQICGRDDRLSVEQVLAIRELSNNHSATEIASRIGALNVRQVQLVIDGKTYARVT